jgi:hypothetical protein
MLRVEEGVYRKRMQYRLFGRLGISFWEIFGVFVAAVGAVVEDSELREPSSGVLAVVAELIIPPIHPCPAKTCVRQL